MKVSLVLILLSFLSTSLMAQTIIPGGTINGAEWRKENSPYIITGDLVIEFLTINPGVSVQFSGNWKFEINNYFKADGFYSDSISFKSAAGNSSGWKGLKFKSSASSGCSVSYCSIENANLQGILIEGVTPTIANCRIAHNVGNGLAIKSASLGLKHCKIHDNLANGLFLDDCQIMISNSIISSNDVAGLFSSDANDQITLTNVVVADNIGAGVDVGNIGITIKNSIIYYNLTGIVTANLNPDITYSDIQGEPVIPGFGNINLSPGFKNRFDYYLSDQSPGIDTGDPLIAYHDKYFPPSKGGERNDMGAYGGPEANRWYPPLYVLPQQYDFGKVTIDSTQSVRCQIFNYREVGITVSDISFTGNGSDLFSSDPQFFYLPVADSIELTVYFTPDSEAVFNTILSLQSQSFGEVFIPFTGEGVVSKMTIFNPQINFDYVLLEDSATAALIFLNGGSDSLRVQVIPPSNPVYSVSTSFLIIPPDSLLDTLLVRFKPDSPQLFPDSLIILSNDPRKQRTPVPVSGTGLGPLINIDRENLYFGTLPVLSDSLLNLAISNTGNDTLLISELKIEQVGGGDPVFMLADSTISFPLTIEPSALKLLAVCFRPVEAGPRNGWLKIHSNDPYLDDIDIALSGTGIAPELVLSISELDFGRIPNNSDSLQNITLYNNGLANLIIYHDSSRITGTNPESFLLNVTSADLTVSPGDSGQISITFRPNQFGKKLAELNIYCNDPLDPARNILLSGISYDPTPANIVEDPYHTSNPFIKGQSGFIGFIITTVSAVDSALLFIRQGGQTDFLPLPVSKQDNNHWLAEIDTAYISERGLEYYLLIWHGWTLTSYPENAIASAVSKQVKVPFLQFPSATPKEIYQMISIPLATDDQQLNELFSDDLGAYDNTSYRLFNCVNDSEYTEVVGLDSPLPPGKALWLITRETTILDVSDGQSLLTNHDFSLILRKGWNMIASPFAFAVNWIEVTDSLALRFYDGSDWPFVSILEPYRGYAVYAPDSMTLAIPPRESSAGSQVPKVSTIMPGDGWQIQIAAQANPYRDQFNYAAVHSAVAAKIDKCNQPEPPPIGNFIQIFFTGGSDQQRFSTDIRRDGENGYTFDFQLNSNLKGEKIIQTYPKNLPSEYDWLVTSSDTRINYGKETIRTSAKKEKYQLLVGRPDYLAHASAGFKGIPSTFSLYQNYPNPFNPATTIEFQLPGSERVSLKIFDTLGRLIKILLADELKDPGYYKVSWDGTNGSNEKVSSGIYFLQFRTEDINRSMKMILQR
jgi:hypothetical protein